MKCRAIFDRTHHALLRTGCSDAFRAICTSSTLSAGFRQLVIEARKFRNLCRGIICVEIPEIVHRQFRQLPHASKITHRHIARIEPAVEIATEVAAQASPEVSAEIVAHHAAKIIAEAIARVAATRLGRIDVPPPAPLYLREADAAPSRDTPPALLDD